MLSNPLRKTRVAHVFMYVSLSRRPNPLSYLTIVPVLGKCVTVCERETCDQHLVTMRLDVAMVRSTHRGTQQRRQKCVVFSLSRPVIFQTQCGLWRMPTSRSGYCVSGAFLRIFPGKTSQKSHFCCFCGALRGWGGIATFSSILGCSDKSFLMFFLGGPLQFF